MGSYSQGKRFGYGRLHYPDMSSYEGMFKWNYPDGAGELHRRDGSRYMGQFVAKKSDADLQQEAGGNGESREENSRVRESRKNGNTTTNRRKDPTTVISPQSPTPSPQASPKAASAAPPPSTTGLSASARHHFHVATMQGFGSMTWSDETEFCGEFVANRREGVGRIKWANAERWLGYLGHWKDGKQHGKGVLYTKGEKTAGTFVNGALTNWL